ncbi:MAG TPA: CDP-glucose 4,6-dehydratase [Desulfovibrio sp.]|nr:CDP-glucose 4,6-dehydratase [Desulfovibrio sp.]
MQAFSQFFEGRSVFVTGHTGFKGAWLSLWLTLLGAKVTGFSLAPPSTPSLFEATGLARHMDHVHGDIRDRAALKAALVRSQASVVFHLAAQALVLPAYRSPLETVEVNVLGSANVLEAVRETESVSTLVCVTSDKCYENREQVWGYRECDPLGGHDPYSASKGAMEILCSSWARSFFQPEGRVAAATVRAGNVIGGGDFGADRIIPDFIRAILAGRPLGIRNPGAVRPWQFVLEPLGGYLWLAALLSRDPARYGGAWNFAPADNTCSVRELVDLFVRAGGAGTWEDASEGKNARHEAGLLRLSSDKARAVLGWKSVLDIEQTAAMTMAGYLPFLRGQTDACRELCLGQITEYTQLAARRNAAWATGRDLP